MFKNNFVVSLKSENKFLKEEGYSVQIPFGNEYSIYLKNLNSQKALVKISIDGKDILSGHKLIVYGNSVLELDGFLDGMSVKNKFKFIRRIKEVEEHRGITPEDGIISVEFDYEKPKQESYYGRYSPTWIYTYPQYPTPPSYVGWYSVDTDNSTNQVSWIMTTSGTTQSNSSYYKSVPVMNFNSGNDGITVRGNDTQQDFGLGYVGEMENNPATISFKLYGFNKEDSPQKKVFVKEKLQCESCGLVQSNINKFCSRCGTRLTN